MSHYGPTPPPTHAIEFRENIPHSSTLFLSFSVSFGTRMASHIPSGAGHGSKKNIFPAPGSHYRSFPRDAYRHIMLNALLRAKRGAACIISPMMDDCQMIAHCSHFSPACYCSLIRPVRSKNTTSRHFPVTGLSLGELLSAASLSPNAWLCHASYCFPESTRDIYNGYFSSAPIDANTYSA